MSGIFRDIRRFGSNNNISQKVLTSTIFLFFSGTLIFLDTGGSFMYGVPIELILPNIHNPTCFDTGIFEKI